MSGADDHEELLTVADLRPFFDAAGITHLDLAFARYELNLARRAIVQRDRIIEALRAQTTTPWPLKDEALTNGAQGGE